MGATYRTSNRRVVDVAETGGQVNVTAKEIGTGFLTVTNREATAVQHFKVTVPCVDTLLVSRVAIMMLLRSAPDGPHKCGVARVGAGGGNSRTMPVNYDATALRPNAHVAEPRRTQAHARR